MDNHHVRINHSPMSCGVAELSGIADDVEAVLYAMANHLYHPSRGAPVAYYVWSGLTDKGNALLLSDYINCHFDSVAVRSTGALNPKTSNEISIWIWNIPHEIFRPWWVSMRVERAKKL